MMFGFDRTILALLVVVPAVLLATILGVATAGREVGLTRRFYAFRVLLLLLLGMASYGLAWAFVQPGTPLALVAALCAFAYGSVALFLCARWSAQRLNDAGSDPWLALLVAVPPVNVLAVIAWCLLRGRAGEAGEPPTAQQ